MIYPGSETRISVTFTVVSTGQKADPTTVTLEVKNPCGSEARYTYDASQVIKDALGQFHYDLAIPDSAESEGEWKYRWTGTGAAVGVVEGKFNVKCSAFTE